MKQTNKLTYLFSLFILASCSLSDKPKDPLGKQKVSKLVGGNPMIKTRSLCQVYQASAFGGVFFVEKITTDMVDHPLHGHVPFSKVTFVRDFAFDKTTPQKFVVGTVGGETNDGNLHTADFDVEIGESYLLLPFKDTNGDLKLSVDAMFQEDSKGKYVNDFFFHLSNATFDRQEFKDHYKANPCVDVPSDRELSKRKNTKKRSKIVEEFAK